MAQSPKRASNVVDIRDDLDTLRKDIAKLGDQISEIGHDSAELSQNTGNQLAARGREIVTRQTEAARETVRRHPGESLAVAVGAGVLVGALLRR